MRLEIISESARPVIIQTGSATPTVRLWLVSKPPASWRANRQMWFLASADSSELFILAVGQLSPKVIEEVKEMVRAAEAKQVNVGDAFPFADWMS